MARGMAFMLVFAAALLAHNGALVGAALMCPDGWAGYTFPTCTWMRVKIAQLDGSHMVLGNCVPSPCSAQNGPPGTERHPR